MARALPFLLSAALLLAARPVVAQVNTEKLRRANEKEGLSGEASGAFELYRGNLSLLRISAGARAEWQTLFEPDEDGIRARKDLAFLVGDVSFGERSVGGVSQVFVSNGFLHARYTRMFVPSFGAEVFGQAQFNEFLLLQGRYLGGLGARAVLISEPWIEAQLGTGYMLEHERLNVEPPYSSSDLNHRWTTYLRFALHLVEDRVTIANTAYVQPRLDDFGDHRILSEGELEVSAGAGFSVALGLYLRYDSEPPTPELKRLDTTFQNRVKLRF
jgi:hypothetical protein